MTDIREFASFGGSNTLPSVPPLPAEDSRPGLEDAPAFSDDAEIDRFEQEIQSYLAGDIDPEDFRRIRLWNGIYGQREITDVHMVRTKIVGGALTADALDAMADVA